MRTRVKVYDDFALRKNERLIFSNNVVAERIDRNLNGKSRPLNNIIDQSKYGPAGLLHAFILSKILHRRLNVWQNDRIVHMFGKPNGKVEIDIEFIRSSRATGLSQLGHWIVHNGSVPPTKSSNHNDCFYQAVGSQIGIDPLDLRLLLVRAMRHHGITKLISSSINPLAMMSAMRGGACYRGSNPSHAKMVLDDSQVGRCHPEGYHGHPRMHAYDESDNHANVQSYSYSRWRSGFLSRNDQNLVCHYALITNTARYLMDALNNGSNKEVRHIGHSEIDYDPLPQAQIWDRGNKERDPGNLRSVCIVGKHFLDQQNNFNNNIFILTFYPML
ncbi:PREDICTED: uncharacterized protein LOC105364410 [Ceratosolen solmsi marchali]|uniref:Uncharacterized protein LOC105364410 n=1 Tax=Ceratosolen solmsi marchali TaxID=326594 RepID=A0AAJ7DY29_9HYME|nr:PREDICTED: uncharacterized protein LOC105364410 [Ceratosolen solmsi marchali]